MQTQSLTAKDSKPKESKPKDWKSVLLRDNLAELAKKGLKKDKK